MKNLFFTVLVLIIISCQNKSNQTQSPRSVISFDSDWLFHRGVATGAEAIDFDDASWRQLALPHDWGIEDIPGTESPLDSNAIGVASSGFMIGGTGWYRKHFSIPKADKNKRLYLQFDGVYMNADVWLNGEHLGNHPYGYTTFGYDVTDIVDFKNENILAVEVKNEGVNSRWYSGSGIYRHVWMIASEEIYITRWGVYITAPKVSKDSALVKAEIKLVNASEKERKLTITSTVSNSEGQVRSITKNNVSAEAGAEIKLAQFFEIEQPKLWSTESPNLYTLTTEIWDEEELIDRTENIFGIRSIEFSAEKGFLLNGKPTLLKGGCMHHGNGPLGAAAYDRAEERRVELMKASGFNAIRCAHNPPSEAFLNACDRLGMLVIDEAFDMWKKAKNPEDYHLYFDEWWRQDVESMVARDRNHPSIIMWSIGNEIPERGEPAGVETSEMIGNFIKELDPTRPVTSAVNGLNPDKDPFFATLDLAGYNYAAGGDHWKKSIYREDHDRVPNRIMYGAESYPLESFGAWMDVIDNPFVIGDFVWTGFDYLGEASIGWLGYWQKKEFYPWSHAYCGDIDICGWKRPQSLYRDVLWENTDKPQIVVVPPKPSFKTNPDKMPWSKWEWHDVTENWNWPGQVGKPMEVIVYNPGDSAELFLNDQSLGVKNTGRGTEFTAKWNVAYEPGILKAVNYRDGNSFANKLVTAGEVNQIKLSADRTKINADDQDLSYVTVELVDDKGIRNSTVEQLAEFELSGPGEIIAVANSNPMSTESYQKPYRRTYQGRCLVIIKSQKEAGEIILKAKSGTLNEASITISTE